MDDLDHRRLGTELGLWHLEDDAPGMVFWHPHGYSVYRMLEDFIRDRMRRFGYAEVRTPQLLPLALWQQSGHLDKFADNMIRADDGDRPMALKPMSCPAHVRIFNQGVRSWRDLPIRYAEFGACHRNEPSGALHGLMRTRAFEQDDAHVFCRDDQVTGEVARVIELVTEVYRALGFAEVEVGLSTRPAVRAGTDRLWDWAEATLGDAARACGLVCRLQPGEGAFYGPKLEFALRDRCGRSWQCGTVQIDRVLPDRLDARYVAADGARALPVMIHHAVFGSLGRFVAILLEHHAGQLPFWLAPVQVAVAPVSRDQDAYAREVAGALDTAGLRATVDAGADTLSRRIVAAHAARVPVIAIVGAREAAARQVTVRERDGAQAQAPLAETVAALARRGAVPGLAVAGPGS